MGRPVIDLAGQRFGRLVAIERGPDKLSPSGQRHTRWLCRCDCGNEKLVWASRLQDGGTGSCGCLLLPSDGPELAARFWSKVDRSAGPDGCWPWLAYVSKLGYGTFGIGGEVRRAHRVAYALATGQPVPDGHHLDHICHTAACALGDDCPHRRCCNPRHLEPVMQKVNNLRSNSSQARNARKTECVNGHEFTDANTYITPKGERECRTCHRLRSARLVACDECGKEIRYSSLSKHRRNIHTLDPTAIRQ